jgi:2-oxoglutarate/2-oxoacid ferredoxin oxidoreductase subunit alpha
MSTMEAVLDQPESLVEKRQIVNDFSIQVATANGSGSQTSNMVLLRSIFQMGVPVSGKNLFPSNIQGLPTWFTIRVNKDGYIARREEIEFMICMNPETAREDIVPLAPGTAVIYDEPLKLNLLRDDLQYFPVPFDKLVVPVCPEAKLRKLVKNMLYTGVAALLLGIDMGEIEKALRKQFGKRKAKAADLNWGACKAGYDFAAEHFAPLATLKIERMNKTQGMIIIDGNSAAALGCLMAGVTVVAWYPITPSSSLVETLIEYLKRFRIDKETGKATFAVVQAEDEIASIGMVIGAGWAGARSMTSTSGPGVSLMSELIGLAYYTEVPGVVVDVQRVGPSTGLPTRTAQGDVLKNLFLSHGDSKHILLFPCSVNEAYEMAQTSFDLAEEFQTIIFLMLDLDLGMNYWMSEQFTYPDKPIARGKVLTAEDLEKLGKFERYRDVDGDGVPYRTVPGTHHPLAPYFNRGSGHNEKAAYSEKPADYKNNMDRLSRKYETARTRIPKSEIHDTPGAEIGIIACGTSHWAVTEARDLLAAQGVKTSYLRLKALPLGPIAKSFINKYQRVYIVDQNRDGQLYEVIRMDIAANECFRLRSVRHYDGMPIPASTVVNQILTQEKNK